MAIGFPPQAAAAIVARRLVQPFRSAAEAAGFASGPGAARLRVGGEEFFTLRSTARIRLPNGQLSDLRRTVAATVAFLPSGYDVPLQILRWYDNAWIP
jgi:hypothetical protein